MNSSKIIPTSLSSLPDNLPSNPIQAKPATQSPSESVPYFPLQIDCYLMRHAQSKYNQVMNSSPYENLSQQAKNTYQMDQSLMDCEITLKGKIEIQNIQFPINIKIENYIHFDIIFVSPLNRTLETAKKVINFHGVRYGKIIVIQELTQVLSKICDFGEGMEKKIQKYGHMFDFYGDDLGNMGKIIISSQTEEQKNKDISNKNHNIDLNDTKSNQIVDNLHHSFWQDNFIDKSLRPQIKTNKQNGQRYVQILNKIFPAPLQSSQNCLKRSLLALQKIKHISHSLKAKRILVISHNRILKNILTKGVKQKLDNFNIMKNCQIRHIKL